MNEHKKRGTPENLSQKQTECNKPGVIKKLKKKREK